MQQWEAILRSSGSMMELSLLHQLSLIAVGTHRNQYYCIANPIDTFHNSLSRQE